MTVEFDDDTLRLVRGYFGGDPRVPRDVTREVFHEYAEEEWTLPEFMALIEDAVAKIPEDKRAEAKVVLEGSYDETSFLKITYCDTETAAEVAERVKRALAYADSVRGKERAEYERLKSKFEPTR